MILKSAPLFRISKICFIGGSLIAVFGASGQVCSSSCGPTYPFIILTQFAALASEISSIHFNFFPNIVGIAIIILGYYLRKKAIMIQRRFEWRETYKTVKY